MSENKKLLTEWTPLSYTTDLIKESIEGNNGKLLLNGILQKCDTLNQNGRIYPRSILERQITKNSLMKGAPWESVIIQILQLLN